jgi:hypothetical protein
VECDTRELSTLLAQTIEAQLKRVGIEATPILQESVKPSARHASVPGRPKIRGASMAVQSMPQVAQRIGLQPAPLVNDSQARVIVHATHPDTRSPALVFTFTEEERAIP